jgi:hypothetical protein
MLDLEPHGPDTFVGVGPRYPWGGLYGGQIVAQALRAAAHTVEPQYRVHSLHAYFIRRGDHTEPIRFEVDRLRNGRSFVTRAVVARQSTGAILNMSASFQVDESGGDIDAAEMPAVRPPDAVEDDTWSPFFDRRDGGGGGGPPGRGGRLVRHARPAARRSGGPAPALWPTAPTTCRAMPCGRAGCRRSPTCRGGVVRHQSRPRDLVPPPGHARSVAPLPLHVRGSPGLARPLRGARVRRRGHAARHRGPGGAAPPPRAGLLARSGVPARWRGSQVPVVTRRRWP